MSNGWDTITARPLPTMLHDAHLHPKASIAGSRAVQMAVDADEKSHKMGPGDVSDGSPFDAPVAGVEDGSDMRYFAVVCTLVRACRANGVVPAVSGHAVCCLPPQWLGVVRKR